MLGRIALISEHASPLSPLGGVDCGGQNLYVAQTAKTLAALGYTIDVFTRRDCEDVPDILPWVNGIRIIHVSAGPPRFVRKEDLLQYMEDFTEYMVRFCRHQQDVYDLVHANFWMSGLVAANIKRQLKIPFVITFHALGRVRRQYQRQDDGFPDDRFAIEDRIIAETDRIVAEAPQDQEDLIRLYGADPARITIVPCGFDPDELWPIGKTQARDVLGLPPDEGMVLHVGRMVPRKGVDTVIRGFAQLLKRHRTPARLLIVGGESEEPDPSRTPEIARLQRLAADLRVTEPVTFVGRRGRDQLKYYYSAADVFVTTPWYEPFGITPLEAMACGTPVVASNVGGIKFSVRDGETGYLVPPDDPARLADAMHRLYSSPPLLSLFGRQAIQRVHNRFTWAGVAEDLSRLYTEVVTASRPSPLGQSHASALRIVDRSFDTALESLRESKLRLRAMLIESAQMLETCVSQGGNILVWDADGHIAEAEYFTAALVTHFGTGHAGLPALWLRESHPQSPSISHYLKALARPHDVLLGIAIEPLSPSTRQSFQLAKQLGLHTIALVGSQDAGPRDLADLMLPASPLPCARLAPQLLIHILSELMKERVALLDRQRQETQPILSIAEWMRRSRLPGIKRHRSANYTVRNVEHDGEHEATSGFPG
jgi:D-inositol-3-phosphate glycosyltransferase